MKERRYNNWLVIFHLLSLVDTSLVNETSLVLARGQTRSQVHSVRFRNSHLVCIRKGSSPH